jgi:hypothetical protein
LILETSVAAAGAAAGCVVVVTRIRRSSSRRRGSSSKKSPSIRGSCRGAVHNFKTFLAERRRKNWRLQSSLGLFVMLFWAFHLLARSIFDRSINQSINQLVTVNRAILYGFDSIRLDLAWFRSFVGSFLLPGLRVCILEYTVERIYIVMMVDCEGIVGAAGAHLCSIL